MSKTLTCIGCANFYQALCYAVKVVMSLQARAVTRNYSEKSINSILDYISTCNRSLLNNH